MAIRNAQGVSLAKTTLNLNIVSTLYEAPDNHITHGTSFANWTVDSGSTKASDGITVKQNSTSEFAYVDVSGLAPSTTYWCMINVSSKSAGVTGSNGLAVEAAGSNGSNFGAVAGLGQVSLASAAVGVPYYFQLRTDGSAGPWRLRLIHIGSSNNETVKFSAFHVYPIPARSTAKINILGDREGGFNAVYASLSNRAVVEAEADTTNLIMLGDHAGANSYGTCDCLQLTGTTTNGSNTITGISNADYLLCQIGCGITGTGIPANTVVNDLPAANTLQMSQNATASGTITFTLTSYLFNHISTRGGARYICVGNHDFDGSNETLVDDYFPIIQTANSGKFYYSHVLGECEFFFIDDNDAASGNNGQSLTDNAGGIGTTQANFQASTAGQYILTRLAASTARWKIMCIHHPVWSSSSAGSGYAANRWAWRTLGFDMVLQAHVHGVERLYKDGLYYITQAMGGGNHHGWGTRLAETKWRLDSTVTASFATTYGYFKLHDSANELVIEYYNTSHQLLDRAKIQKAPA